MILRGEDGLLRPKVQFISFTTLAVLFSACAAMSVPAWRTGRDRLGAVSAAAAVPFSACLAWQGYRRMKRHGPSTGGE
jgi:hypothetical protein